MKKIILFLVLTFSTTMFAQHSLVNFQHLRHLTETIQMSGDSVDIIHVYANYPLYEWVDAKESGPEGIACVDDAGRAAVVYLRHYELTKNQESLARARSLLKFILKMQANDGEFYNFIFADHSINKDGKTSFKSFGWWASRGVWSLSLGYRIFKDVDSSFAVRLRNGVERALPHVANLLIQYGKTREINSYKIPQWLMYESGADATTELLLGLIEYYSITNDMKVAKYIKQLCDGLMLMQDGDAKKFPYGAHRSWQTMWHMWGNSQTQVLASAGKVLHDKKMIASAEQEAQWFYSRLLIEGLFKEMDISVPSKKITYEQIAYGIRPMAVGLLRLYDATGKEEYLTMAGLTASWFFGNNILRSPMYDSTTGRGFDGIRDSVTMNKNSGAESTVEALYTVIEIEQYQKAKQYLNYIKISQGIRGTELFATFKNSKGEEITIVCDSKAQGIKILNSKALKHPK